MKALVYENYAENDDFESILQIKDVPEPTPKPNDVIFRVKAAALNYDDIWGMRGKPLAVPLPHVSGTDAAGEVIAIGDNSRLRAVRFQSTGAQGVIRRRHHRRAGHARGRHRGAGRRDPRRGAPRRAVRRRTPRHWLGSCA